MMNEVRIHTFTDTEIPYTEEQLFNKLCNMYENTPIKNISSLWFQTYYTFMNCLIENLEDAYNEGRNNREELENYNFFRRSINDTNLLIIKTYAPDIYNSHEYKFDYDEYDEFFDDEFENSFFKLVFEPTLKICADILNTHFKERFNNYINEKDAELSGSETDTETDTETETETETETDTDTDTETETDE